MRVVVSRGAPNGALLMVPGDKSIAHRWLMLAATAEGKSVIHRVPGSLDVRSTASCLSALCPAARPGLEPLTREDADSAEGHGSTWNEQPSGEGSATLEVEGKGRRALIEPGSDLYCGNSGTSMRLLAGLVAPAPIRVVMAGDASLSVRPMERVAEPLRAMGAQVDTTDGHAPVTVRGGSLRGVSYRIPIPSAQVKGAILFAASGAEGTTRVDQTAAVRDHTERALRALGAELEVEGSTVRLEGPFQHRGFEVTVPGDPSSAAFILAAAAIASIEVRIEGVGLNPTRLGFVDVLRRMGLEVDLHETGRELDEPVGSLRARPAGPLVGVLVDPDELPLIVDEVPALAAAAAFAKGESWFTGAGELRVKESDRLSAIASGLRDLGGVAADEGDDLVIGGGGLRGGAARSGGDHRIAMALAICGLASDGAVEVDGIESAAVSFPGFLAAVREIGAEIQEVHS